MNIEVLYEVAGKLLGLSRLATCDIVLVQGAIPTLRFRLSGNDAALEFSEGMVALFETPDEIAATIGHEMGHIELFENPIRAVIRFLLGTPSLLPALLVFLVAPAELLRTVSIGAGLLYLLMCLVRWWSVLVARKWKKLERYAHFLYHLSEPPSIGKKGGRLFALAVIIFWRPGLEAVLLLLLSYLTVWLLIVAVARSEEYLADLQGVVFAKKAGFDPSGAVSMMQKLTPLQRDSKSGITRIFAMHPLLSERLKRMRFLIEGCNNQEE